MPKEKSESFPLVVTLKSCPGFASTIYKIEQTKNDKVYTSYVLSYFMSGKRIRKTFADLAEAKQEAERAISLMANGEADLLEFSREDRALLQRARGALGNLPVALDLAALEYSQASGILKGTGTICQAAEFWIKHHDPNRKVITVQEAADAIIAEAEADKKSRDRVNDLSTHLHAFAKDVNCEVSLLDSSILTKHLTGLACSNRSKANRRSMLAFFNKWLIRHNYLAKGTDLLEHVQKYSKEKTEDVEIFTPAEMRQILETAAPHWVPYFALAAFSGLRRAEILRLDWSQIDLDDNLVTVRRSQAKKRKRRLPPICENLRAWLLPYRETSGKVIHCVEVDDELARICKVLGWEKWKHNGLRHSFISYRLALTENINSTAHAAGNSPGVIEQDYKHAVKPALAREWFSIMPTAPDNVTTLPTQTTVEAEVACSV